MSREFTVAAFGSRLHGVDSFGDGPPLLFLNGGSSTRRQWNPVIRRLGDRYRTVSFDSGRSRGPSARADYSVRGAIDDVDRVIEATMLRRPVLVGRSQGATIAVCYAAEHPELVGGLVLVDGAYPVSPPAEAAEARAAAAPGGGGWITRVVAGLRRAAGPHPRYRAAVALATDEVNSGLAPDFAALHCPTVFLVGSSRHPGPSQDRTLRNRAAAAQAARSNPQVTVFGTMTGHSRRVGVRDTGIVAAAIDEVVRRTRERTAGETAFRRVPSERASLEALLTPLRLGAHQN
ncbi:alpha/beta fold hydrolase [Streptomyces sp. NPDC054961]